jgi:hypothetical protein
VGASRTSKASSTGEISSNGNEFIWNPFPNALPTVFLFD